MASRAVRELRPTSAGVQRPFAAANMRPKSAGARRREDSPSLDADNHNAVVVPIRKRKAEFHPTPEPDFVVQSFSELIQAARARKLARLKELRNPLLRLIDTEGHQRDDIQREWAEEKYPQWRDHFLKELNRVCQLTLHRTRMELQQIQAGERVPRHHMQANQDSEWRLLAHCAVTVRRLLESERAEFILLESLDEKQRKRIDSAASVITQVMRKNLALVKLHRTIQERRRLVRVKDAVRLAEELWSRKRHRRFAKKRGAILAAAQREKDAEWLDCLTAVIAFWDTQMTLVQVHFQRQMLRESDLYIRDLVVSESLSVRNALLMEEEDGFEKLILQSYENLLFVERHAVFQILWTTVLIEHEVMTRKSLEIAAERTISLPELVALLKIFPWWVRKRAERNRKRRWSARELNELRKSSATAIQSTWRRRVATHRVQRLQLQRMAMNERRSVAMLETSSLEQSVRGWSEVQSEIVFGQLSHAEKVEGDFLQMEITGRRRIESEWRGHLHEDVDAPRAATALHRHLPSLWLGFQERRRLQLEVGLCSLHAILTHRFLSFADTMQVEVKSRQTLWAEEENTWNHLLHCWRSQNALLGSEVEARFTVLRDELSVEQRLRRIQLELKTQLELQSLRGFIDRLRACSKGFDVRRCLGRIRRLVVDEHLQRTTGPIGAEWLERHEEIHFTFYVESHSDYLASGRKRLAKLQELDFANKAKNLERKFNEEAEEITAAAGRFFSLAAIEWNAMKALVAAKESDAHSPQRGLVKTQSEYDIATRIARRQASSKSLLSTTSTDSGPSTAQNTAPSSPIRSKGTGTGVAPKLESGISVYTRGGIATTISDIEGHEEKCRLGIHQNPDYTRSLEKITLMHGVLQELLRDDDSSSSIPSASASASSTSSLSSASDEEDADPHSRSPNPSPPPPPAMEGFNATKVGQSSFVSPSTEPETTGPWVPVGGDLAGIPEPVVLDERDPLSIRSAETPSCTTPTKEPVATVLQEPSSVPLPPEAAMMNNVSFSSVTSGSTERPRKSVRIRTSDVLASMEAEEETARQKIIDGIPYSASFQHIILLHDYIKELLDEEDEEEEDEEDEDFKVNDADSLEGDEEFEEDEEEEEEAAEVEDEKDSDADSMASVGSVVWV